MAFRNTTERSKYPISGAHSVIGHFTFGGQTIEFYDAYSAFRGSNFLIEDKFFGLIKDLSKSVGELYIDVYSDKSDTTFSGSRIEQVYLTTNFPGKIEVCFETNIPLDRMRQIKLDLLINE